MLPEKSSRRACLFTAGARSFLEAAWRPAADIYRTKTGWLAKFDLAGIRLEDIRLQACGSRLTLQGVRRDWAIEKGHCYHSMEISYSEFERHIEFPVDLENALISTEYEAGMLLVRIQTEEERP
ncbi:MAG TPA: Hsp20/alpha crystallin family protein [Gemmataceae bacterium]|nr:Hsp20/alpha crystallin family protein [Gemmataceae bacterium]